MEEAGRGALDLIICDGRANARVGEGRFCDSSESLIELVEAGGVDAGVADVRDITSVRVLPAFAALRRQAPHLPLILYCLPTPGVLREIPDPLAVDGD